MGVSVCLSIGVGAGLGMVVGMGVDFCVSHACASTELHANMPRYRVC